MRLELSERELDDLAERITAKLLAASSFRSPVQPPEYDGRLLYSERQAAEMLGISPHTLRQWRLQGRVASTTTKRPIKYDRDSINAVATWMKGRGD